MPALSDASSGGFVGTVGSPTFRRIPSIDRERGAIAARRHIRITQLDVNPLSSSPPSVSPPSSASSTSSLSSTSSRLLPAVIPIPFNEDVPPELITGAPPLPGKSEGLEREGGEASSAAEDLEAFENGEGGEGKERRGEVKPC